MIIVITTSKELDFFRENYKNSYEWLFFKKNKYTAFLPLFNSMKDWTDDEYP